MGKREAIADGIEFYYDTHRAARGHNGVTVYKVNCEVCGEPMEVINYGRGLTYICDKCKAKKAQHKKEVEKAWFDVIETKGERRYNKALDKIQNQVKDFSEYDKAIRIARKAQDKYGSVPEAMVAVELIRLGYSFVPQQKIGRYHVDFYIPKIKTVIEVDGAIFHEHRQEGERDIKIRQTLGWSTAIIHIPAEWISKHIQRLGETIDKMIK